MKYKGYIRDQIVIAAIFIIGGGIIEYLLYKGGAVHGFGALFMFMSAFPIMEIIEEIKAQNE